MDRDEQELVPPIEQEQTLGGPIGVPTPEESIQPLESAEDRSSLRKKRVTLTTFSSGIATALTILSFMITVPLTIRYLGNERYGIWLTLGGLTNLLGLADLGMGFSIQNAISKADGEGDVDRISTICSSGALSLIFAAVLLTVVGVGVIEIVPLQKMFNVHSPLAISELKPSAIVFLLCFSGSIVTSLVLRVQKGLQLGYVTNAWQSASALVGLVTVVTAALLKANLPVLLFCSFGTPLLVATLNGIVFFSRPIRGAMINWRSESRAVTKNLLRSGSWFLALQAAWAFAYGLDNLIIAYWLGPVAVTPYAVAFRVFGMVTVAVSLYTHALWPAYAEAYARGEVQWVGAKLKSTIRMSLLFSFCASTTLYFLAPMVIRVWTHGKVNPGPSLAAGLAVFVLLDTVRYAVSDFLGALSILRFQTILLFTYGLCALAAKTWAVTRFGIVGVAWAAVAAFAVSYLAPTAVYCKLKLPKILKVNQAH